MPCNYLKYAMCNGRIISGDDWITEYTEKANIGFNERVRRKGRITR